MSSPAAQELLPRKYTRAECRTVSLSASKDVAPCFWILEHYFANQPNRRRTVAQEFVVKMLQRKVAPLLLLPILPQFEDLQLPNRVIQVSRIVSPAQRLLVGRLVLIIAIALEEFRRLIERHSFAMRFDRHTHAAQAQQRLH